MMTEVEARRVRANYLRAFDVYKSNVRYGIITETPEEHAATLEWYQSMLDLPLDEQSYKDSPKRIKQYLQRLL